MENYELDLNHTSHLNIYSKLRLKRLNHLIEPYKALILSIPGNSQKKIFHTFKKDLTAKEYSNFLIKYFDKYKIDYSIKEIKKYKDSTNAERNKNYRKLQEQKKRVKLSFYVDSDFVDKIKRLQGFKGGDFTHCKTYEDTFKVLFNEYITRNFTKR